LTRQPRSGYQGTGPSRTRALCGTKPAEKKHILKVDRITKRYGQTAAVDEVSFEVARGQILVLLGESGCGKTTTLKMINRLIEPTSGAVWIDGALTTDVDPIELRRSIGYVFQNFALFPHMTVAENIAITPDLLGRDAIRVRDRVDELLSLVQLPPPEFRDRLPAELSGGQLQRVGFVRALAASPSLVLLDEPFGALDPITRDSVQTEFRDIQRTLGFTAVLVTHDMTEALMLADRILVLRNGRAVQLGTPEDLISNPSSEYIDSLMSMPRRQAETIDALLEQARSGSAFAES